MVGLFLAPPSGSASRARQIPMSNKRKFHGPRPLRADCHPNGRLNLSVSDRQRVSQANKLYDLTPRLVEWATSNGCIICVENQQFSLFWATTFWTSVAHLVSYAVFHSCQYGSARQKKTTVAFSHHEFAVVKAVCKGQNSKHKHAKWGYNAKEKEFATREETAYTPWALQRCLQAALSTHFCQKANRRSSPNFRSHQRHILAVFATNESCQWYATKASRIPALVPTFSTKVRLRGCPHSMPDFKIFQKTTADIVCSESRKQYVPKGARLLSILPSDFENEGDGDDAWEFVDEKNHHHDHTKHHEHSQHQEVHVQTWGIPWSPEQFVCQAVKAGHPILLQACLPPLSRELGQEYHSTSTLARVQHRISRVKHWMARAKQLEEDDWNLVSSMHPDGASVLRGNGFASGKIC